ncbi:hypothetical protein [Sandarakinorhabdus sp. AAP62]|uniref:hypothetical protein n=1 Tax=Sandarakinorhabdus sp. AAP62 TaxID=1248916 RepID=UPI0002F63BED|nr:hypothetical protein [Sandarakinorhabdus sp. AAP62]
MNLWHAITTVDDWLHANHVLVAGVSIAAFVLSCAHYAGFLRLPELWQLPAQFAWIIPALRYGVWEAAVTPKLRDRRARLEGKSND